MYAGLIRQIFRSSSVSIFDRKTHKGRTLWIILYHYVDTSFCNFFNWLDNRGAEKFHVSENWFGQMSLPRELFVRNGRLYQKPIREFDALRCNKAEYKDVPVNGLVRLAGIEGRQIDMELQIRPADGERIFQKFAVRFAQDEIHHTAISFRPLESILKVDRKFSGSRRAIIHQRRSLINHDEGKLKLRIVLDRFSVEVFVNDGEQVMTAAIDTLQTAKGISFFADGDVIIDVVKYDIRDIDR